MGALNSEAGYAIGEGHALRMAAECYIVKKDYKSGVRAAEKARALYRELENTEYETVALYLVAQCSLQTAVSEGAMGGTQLSRTAKDAVDKATKTAELAVKKAKLLTVEGAG